MGRREGGIYELVELLEEAAYGGLGVRKLIVPSDLSTGKEKAYL